MLVALIQQTLVGLVIFYGYGDEIPGPRDEANVYGNLRGGYNRLGRMNLPLF